MANRHPSHYLDIGVFREELVAQWLQSTGWVILIVAGVVVGEKST